MDADATRRRHFKLIVGSGLFLLPVTALAVGAFVWGASKESVPVMAGVPAGVVLAALVIAFMVADRRAESEFFRTFAERRGLAYSPQGSSMAFTPLLGAGDRRRFEHWMQGQRNQVPCRLSHYTYEIKRESRDSNGNRSERWEPHHFTVVILDMEHAMAQFPGFFLRQRRGLFERLSDDEWLSGRGFPRVELESTRFCERYDLFRDRSMQELDLRQLFSPTLVHWLAEHPLELGAEFKAGTLVVFLEGHVEEAGKLDWLIECALELRGRVEREVREATHR